MKPEKCRFGDNEVDYLGFNISEKGTRPSRKKVVALVRLSPPQDTRTLESFLFSINYYRSDIPRFGDLTVDLFDLVARKTKLCKWNDTLIANFKALSQALANAPILAFPDFDKPFVIQGCVCREIRPVSIKQISSTLAISMDVNLAKWSVGGQSWIGSYCH